MKAVFAVLSALATLGAAAQNAAVHDASPEVMARGLELVQRAENCHECIDRCQSIGGLGDAACKVIVCSVECVLLDNNHS